MSDANPQLDKLYGTLRFALIAGMIGVGIYYTPTLIQRFREDAVQEAKAKTPEEQKADEAELKKKKEADLRRKVGDDALGRIQDRGQEIVNAAFPQRIGAAPFKSCKLDSVAGKGDGYQALVTLYYTNILKDDNFMELLLSYDSTGAFAGITIGRCNDRWIEPGRRINVWER